MGGLKPLRGGPLSTHQQQQRRRDDEPGAFEDLEAELDAALAGGGGGARNNFSSRSPPLPSMMGPAVGMERRLSAESAASTAIDLTAYNGSGGGFGGAGEGKYAHGAGARSSRQSRGGSSRPDSPMFPHQGAGVSYDARRLSSGGNSGGGGGLSRLRTPRISGNSGPVGGQRSSGSGGRGGSGGSGGGGSAFGASDSPPPQLMESADDDDESEAESPVHPAVNKVVFATDLAAEGADTPATLSAPSPAGAKKPLLDDLDEDFMDAILEEDT